MYPAIRGHFHRTRKSRKIATYKVYFVCRKYRLVSK
nr:MAG TPA: hypothetical protein [Caudoviricetes sp.]